MKIKFSKLTPAQKRVAIAKDVLLQIKLGKSKVKRRTFGRMVGIGVNDTISQEELSKHPKAVCQACAVGCAVISAIRLFNQEEITNLPGNFDTDVLARWFPWEQAAMIEVAFEKGDGAHICINPGRDTAAAFGSTYGSNTDRAVAIFKNIIRNKGTFKP